MNARRGPQVVLIVTMLGHSWLMMQAVHELGHVLGGWVTGGEVERVVLHPLTISRTDLGNNPQPLIVCWAGPITGSVAPLALWLILHVVNAKRRVSLLQACLKFFAGFCLIANGAYLAVGVREGIGDAGDLLRYGAAPWMLYLFGAITIPVGFWLWNGLGRSFGLGTDGESITWRPAALSAGLLAVTITVESIWG